MAAATILILVLLTSAGACLVGVRRHRLPAAALRPAGARVLEGLGWSALFFGANLLMGILAVGIFRVVTGQFVTVYGLNDLLLVVLSLLQGLWFQAWRAHQRTAGGPPPRAMPRPR
jgi:hypothetical protein